MLLRHIQLIFSSLDKDVQNRKMFRGAQQFFGGLFGQIGLLVPWFRCPKASAYKGIPRISCEAGKLPPVFSRVQGSAAFPNSRFSAVIQCVLLSSLVLVRRSLP
jgi:hypothetical protein